MEQQLYNNFIERRNLYRILVKIEELRKIGPVPEFYLELLRGIAKKVGAEPSNADKYFYNQKIRESTIKGIRKILDQFVSNMTQYEREREENFERESEYIDGDMIYRLLQDPPDPVLVEKLLAESPNTIQSIQSALDFSNINPMHWVTSNPQDIIYYIRNYTGYFAAFLGDYQLFHDSLAKGAKYYGEMIAATLYDNEDDAYPFLFVNHADRITIRKELEDLIMDEQKKPENQYNENESNEGKFPYYIIDHNYPEFGNTRLVFQYIPNHGWYQIITYDPDEQ